MWQPHVRSINDLDSCDRAVPFLQRVCNDEKGLQMIKLEKSKLLGFRLAANRSVLGAKNGLGKLEGTVEPVRTS